VFDVFKKWLAQVKNETGLKFKCLKLDNVGEYCDSRFKEFCANRRIKRVKTVTENPHQNRVAEPHEQDHSRACRYTQDCPSSFG